MTDSNVRLPSLNKHSVSGSMDNDMLLGKMLDGTDAYSPNKFIGRTPYAVQRLDIRSERAFDKKSMSTEGARSPIS